MNDAPHPKSSTALRKPSNNDLEPSCPQFWKLVFRKRSIARATRVAAIVGTILVLINQGDDLLAGDTPSIWKIILTYLVPFSVSSYTGASMRIEDWHAQNVHGK